MLLSKKNSRWPGAKWLLGCLLFVFTPRCEAQNLVPNGSFEEADSCISGLGFVADDRGPLNWFSAYLTPDYLQSCLPPGAVNGLPLNFFTYQEPFDGFSCIGMGSYILNGVEEQREWVMVHLTEPLVVGQAYYASFYANAGFGGNAQYPQIWLGSNNIGMVFTTQARPWHLVDPYPVALDFAHVFQSEVLTDTIGWTMVSGSFIADSAYQYLMVGNFFSNALTDTVHFAPQGNPWEWFPRGYTLIDKVCVSLSPLGCDLQQGVVSATREANVLFPNPATSEIWIKEAQGASAVFRDALGRVIWQVGVTSNNYVVNVSGWARGAYVLDLEGEKKHSSFKFVLVGD
ncbi:MAG: T9SS type A sorting domain-containing protein [Flavobacteriales bacterium]|jgi:hypothetical protein|nr:T9SS type A sorting domain-containing protein [Flavobacteriales bacterium]MCI1752140.1 T9SS type A sorting domain-containing protein [Flavobacteriales bacterium]